MEYKSGQAIHRGRILRGRTLLIIAAIAYAAAWLLGESILANAIGTIGLVALLTAIIAFIREAQARKKAKNQVPRV